MNREPLTRRTFVQAATVAGVAAVAGCSSDGDESTPTPTPTEADDSGGGGGDSASTLAEEPDYGGYLEGANQYDKTVDYRDQDSVTVAVGGGDGLAFEPAAIAVSTGTTVTWEWTGNGGQHNVMSDDLGFQSETTGEEGHTFEYTFDEAGTYTYYCDPHEAIGMKGGVHVE